MQTYAGSLEEKGFQVCATIDGLQGRKLDFLVSICSQSIPTYKYQVPNFWKIKYNLPDDPESEAGINSITVGKDNCELFPKILEISGGVCISQSNITGNYILSGRAIDSSEKCLMANHTVVNNDEMQVIVAQTSATGLSRYSVAKPDTGPWSGFKAQPAKNVYAAEDKRVLTEISTDSINVPPVKRCVK